MLTFKEPRLHQSEERTSLSSHLRAISQTLFQQRKTLRIVTVLLATSLLLSVIFEFGPLWQIALAAPVGLYGLANATVLLAGGVGALLAARLTLAKSATIVGVAGLLVVSSLALVVVRNTVVVILAQGVLVAGGVGISMIFTRLLHDSLSSQVRAGAASGVGALSSIAFVLFALIFGVVSQHVGIFHAGWMVVGVTLLASMLLVTVSVGFPLRQMAGGFTLRDNRADDEKEAAYLGGCLQITAKGLDWAFQRSMTHNEIVEHFGASLQTMYSYP